MGVLRENSAITPRPMLPPALLGLALGLFRCWEQKNHDRGRCTARATTPPRCWSLSPRTKRHGAHHHGGPPAQGGILVRPLCRKPAPGAAASPSAAAPSCLRTRGGLERNPTDNPTSRPEGPPQVLFSRRTSTTRQIRRDLLVGSALNKGAGPVAGAPPGKRQRGPPHRGAPDPKRRTRRPAHHKTSCSAQGRLTLRAPLSPFLATKSQPAAPERPGKE